MNTEFDIGVVGGGLVGVAAAQGMVGVGRRVVLFDEGDVAFRASRGNFGLVWVQGKGVDFPSYADWTRSSAELWPAFARELEAETGVRLGYSRPGGLELCMHDADYAAREAKLARLSKATEGRFEYEMLDGRALRERLPDVSTKVAGASYCPHDGHVNPLFLLRALHQSFVQRGGRYLPDHGVSAVRARHSGFEVRAGGRDWRCGRVLLAAGLGNIQLAPMLGLTLPLRPNRGQVLVTERVRPFLHLPTVQLRQTVEGSLLIGDSHEDVGFDEATVGQVMSGIARHAVTAFPMLKDLRLARAWGALRIMTSDGYPVYQESKDCPGAFVTGCHSGVTLAAVHAQRLGSWVNGNTLPEISAFSTERFNV